MLRWTASPELPGIETFADSAGYDPRTEPLLPGRLAVLVVWPAQYSTKGRVRFPRMSRAAAGGPHGRRCLPKGIEGVAGGGSKKAEAEDDELERGFGRVSSGEPAVKRSDGAVGVRRRRLRQRRNERLRGQ